MKDENPAQSTSGGKRGAEAIADENTDGSPKQKGKGEDGQATADCPASVEEKKVDVPTAFAKPALAVEQ